MFSCGCTAWPQEIHFTNSVICLNRYVSLCHIGSLAQSTFNFETEVGMNQPFHKLKHGQIVAIAKPVFYTPGSVTMGAFILRVFATTLQVESISVSPDLPSGILMVPVCGLNTRAVWGTRLPRFVPGGGAVYFRPTHVAHVSPPVSPPCAIPSRLQKRKT